MLLKGPKGRINQEGKLFAGTITEFNPNRQKEKRRIRFLFSKWGFLLSIFALAFLTIGLATILAFATINGSNNPQVLKNIAEFDIDKYGNIKIQSSSNVVNQGTFVVNSSFYSSLSVPNNVVFLIIRHSHNNSLIDTIYSIPVGQHGGTIFTNFESQIVKQNVFVVDDANDAVGTISVYGEDNSLLPDFRITTVTHT